MANWSSKASTAVCRYFDKWTGEEKSGPGLFPTPTYVILSTLGGFAAVGIMAASVVASPSEARAWLTVLASHGATMVLVFASPAGPFSQPRNIIVGNIIASLVGVGCRIWIAEPMGTIGFALPFCLGLSYLLMHLTRSLNPPAGGTAAIAVVSSPDIDGLGWKLIIPAVLYGVVFIVLACIFINLIPGQRYPKYWFVDRSTARKTAAIVTCKKMKKTSNQKQEETTTSSDEENAKKPNLASDLHLSEMNVEDAEALAEATAGRESADAIELPKSAEAPKDTAEGSTPKLSIV